MKLVKRIAVVLVAAAALQVPTIATASGASADGGSTGDVYHIAGF
jgi:hypothetical protein